MMVLSGLYNPYNNPTYKRTYLSGQHAFLPAGAKVKLPCEKNAEAYRNRALLSRIETFISQHTMDTIVEENLLGTSNSNQNKETAFVQNMIERGFHVMWGPLLSFTFDEYLLLWI